MLTVGLICICTGAELVFQYLTASAFAGIGSEHFGVFRIRKALNFSDLVVFKSNDLTGLAFNSSRLASFHTYNRKHQHFAVELKTSRFGMSG